MKSERSYRQANRPEHHVYFNVLGGVALMTMCAWAMAIAACVLVIAGVPAVGVAWGALGMSAASLAGIVLVIWGMADE